jgi:hypothetical protein
MMSKTLRLAELKEKEDERKKIHSKEELEKQEKITRKEEKKKSKIDSESKR